LQLSILPNSIDIHQKYEVGMTTPIVTLEIPGTPTIILRKKADICIGRAEDAHIQFIDPAVSRIHATIKWKASESYPILSDANSSSGLQVDDQYVEWKHLHHVHQIVIGSNKIRAIFHEDKSLLPPQIDLKGVVIFPALKKSKKQQKVAPTKIQKIGYFDDVMPFTYKSEEERETEKLSMAAILSELDTVDGVVLFKNYGKPDEKGRVRSNRQLHELLTFLEEKERTGTLTLYGEHTGEITFANGKIRRALCGKLTEMAAVQHIFMFPNAGFIFSYSCEVGEARIDLAPTKYLQQMIKHVTKAVARPSKRLSKSFEEEDLQLTPAKAT
jgi:pSer/pThr/pTyr-binding forkhead associated (FHA) protein